MYDELIAKLRRPYPQARIEWRVSITVALLFTVGVTCSIFASDWTHFGRVGSLIVIVGVYIAWRDITGKIDGARVYLESVIQEEKEEVRGMQGGLIVTARKQKCEEELDVTEAQLKDVLKTTRNRIRALEVMTIVGGTSIWGYGGYFGELLFQ